MHSTSRSQSHLWPTQKDTHASAPPAWTQDATLRRVRGAALLSVYRVDLVAASCSQHLRCVRSCTLPGHNVDASVYIHAGAVSSRLGLLEGGQKRHPKARRPRAVIFDRGCCRSAKERAAVLQSCDATRRGDGSQRQSCVCSV